MPKYLIKRDGRKKVFHFVKIKDAIKAAYLSVYKNTERFDKEWINILDGISKVITNYTEESIEIELVQDIVVENLEKYNSEVAASYKDYRKKRSEARKHPTDKAILELIQGTNDFLSKENANKRSELASTQRDLMAGTISRHLARQTIPKYIMDAHDDGIIKNHDLDYYINPISNCSLINLKDMFENGTVINDRMIETPKSLQTAMTLATQIIVQVASNQYGGCTVSLAHIAPFVRVSYEKYVQDIIQEHKDIGKECTLEEAKTMAKIRLKKREIPSSVQTLNYQVNTMSGQNGQTPFVTIFIYLNEEDGKYTEEIAMLAEEIFKQRIIGMKNRYGKCTTQTFPKLIFVLDENNVHPHSKYHWLLQLAMECTAKRQSPDYQSAKMMKEIYGDVFPTMGCRSLLFPFKVDGKYKFYGRYNLGVQTINLPDIALSSKKNEKEFWKIFEDRMENLIKPMGILRYEKLKGVKSDVAPLLWQDGAFARLKPGEPIMNALNEGSFSVSIGYAGLNEAVYYMTGKKLIDEEGYNFGIKVMKFLEDKADKWKEETGLGFSVYGTPQEETVTWFTDRLVKKFGLIEGVTDKGYITNSYHVDPHDKIDAFDKLKLEGKLQKHSKGGCVSYVETLGLENNIPALYEVIKCIYENNTHAEINSQSDCTCHKCNYKGKFNIVDEKWICPNCNNDDPDEMTVVVRVCGYLSDKGVFTHGRMADIAARHIHI